MQHAPAHESPWRPLLHRWFVEYNPLYLLSATLVLGGTVLSSRGLAHDGSLYGELGVAAISEVYAIALIAGAALLFRLGQRRSAFMLAVLTALYQCDVTLHTETSANLGWAGIVASSVWLALFAGKLEGLAWAMKLRLSRTAWATAGVGGGGLALLPYVLRELDARPASALVALWLFAVVALQRCASISSAGALDSWGATVLRRTSRVVWLGWGALLLLHVVFWSTQCHLQLAIVAPLVPLVLTRGTRSEARMWFVVAATLVIVAAKLPAAFSMTALIAAGVLVLRVLSATRAAVMPVAEVSAPYRGIPPLPVNAETNIVLSPRAERRLFVLAGCGVYLSAWTATWSGGAWPAHLLALDVVVTVAALLVLWHRRAPLPTALAAVAWLHVVLQDGLFPAPRSLVGWGALAMGIGFLLLLGSLAVSYALRSRPERWSSGPRSM